MTLDIFLTLNIDSYENSLPKLTFCNMVKFSTVSLKAEVSYGVTSSSYRIFNYHMGYNGRRLRRCHKQVVNCSVLAESLLDWVGESLAKPGENPSCVLCQELAITACLVVNNVEQAFALPSWSFVWSSAFPQASRPEPLECCVLVLDRGGKRNYLVLSMFLVKRVFVLTSATSAGLAGIAIKNIFISVSCLVMEMEDLEGVIGFIL